MIYFIVLLVNLAALIFVFQRGFPQPFPWRASLALACVLLFGGLLSPMGGIERGVGFVTLLSAFIVTAQIRRHAWIRKSFSALAALLTLFLIADALRLLHSPDVTVTTGETFALLRRPYLLEHPNVKAAWLLLLSASPLTLAGILTAQSRGALLGWIAASARFIPKRHYLKAGAVGLLMISAAATLRPGTFFGRTEIWREGAAMFLSAPLAGIGSGAYAAADTIGMTTAHNAALTIAAENGLIGLAAFGAWTFGAGTLVFKSHSVARYNLLAFAVQQFVDDQWLHPISAILLGAVLAFCLRRIPA